MWPARFARQTLLWLALCCINPAISAFSYSPRPHLVFVEGSLGGGWNSAFSREADIVNGAGPFFWSHDGSFYRYRSSDLMLSAGFGYEFLMLPWVGFRAAYAYHSYLSNWTARTGTGRYSRSSVIGGQVAETDGYFIGPVFRYNPFGWPIHFEFPVLWGMHSGSYKPLQGYTEFRERNTSLPQLTDEYREQPLELSKWRFGLGFAFLQEGFPLYLSMQFLYEAAVTLTTVGPGDVMPAGSAWQSFMVTFAGGWRF
ncbi:hypothetical protein [Turneriella parva]|nr:hypothetical protein [Turneriella parva]